LYQKLLTLVEMCWGVILKCNGAKNPLSKQLSKHEYSEAITDMNKITKGPKPINTALRLTQ